MKDCYYIGRPMRIHIVSIFMITVALFSCSEKKVKSVQAKEEKYEPFIINVQHYFSEAELNMSFPIWFDDSLIAANEIKTITRSTFTSSKESEINFDIPREIKRYYFNDNGQIVKVDFEQYYENIQVGKNTFIYNGEKDSMGYAIVEMDDAGLDETQDNFNIYLKEKYGDKYLAYKNVGSGNYMFCMLRENSWGPLSVDSILNPTQNDIIILGDPIKPKKKYQVKNVVNEFNVIDYAYDKLKTNPKEIFSGEYPFNYKRSILYGNEGVCIGFVDSTFSDDTFLTSRQSTFELQNNLPSLVVHEKKASRSDEYYFQYEKLEYDFYQ